MFQKDLRLDYLLDFYGDILPERTRAMMRQYYEDDLSLSEIAESFGMTRQGVRHFLKKAEEELRHLEECLGMAERHRQLADCTETVRAVGLALLASDEPGQREMGQTLLGTVARIEAQL